MTLFYTNSVKHLIHKIKVKKGRFEITKFSDGEIYIKIKERVKKKSVWVLASTNAPGDNLLELVFMLDVLKREKAEINLLIPFFGYARQDKIRSGEAFSSKIVSNLLGGFKINKIIVIHIHSQRLKQFLNYRNVIPTDLYSPIIKKMDVVVAPDKGVIDLVKEISKKYNIPAVFMKKRRLKKEDVKIFDITGDVKNKKVVIIDDMIVTGNTILKATNKLKQKGAKEVHVISTHGMFTKDAIKRIEKSQIKRVYVTNSLPQAYKSKKIKVIDLSKFIEKIMTG